MEGNLSTETQEGMGGNVVRESPFLVSPAELRTIRSDIATRPDGKFLLRDCGPGYHDRLRSYLATEFVGKVDNPAAEIPEGGNVDPWVAARIGFAKSAEEALTMDAKLGADLWERAVRELGQDGAPLIKSILRNGVSIPPTRSEHQKLYLRCIRFLNQAIQDVSFRQGSHVRLNPDSENYRAETWNQLEGFGDAGVSLPTDVKPGQSLRAKEMLPAKFERKIKPWDKIIDYYSFLMSLSSNNQAGLELVSDLPPMGLRKVFSPAIKTV